VVELTPASSAVALTRTDGKSKKRSSEGLLADTRSVMPAGWRDAGLWRPLAGVTSEVMIWKHEHPERQGCSCFQIITSLDCAQGVPSGVEGRRCRQPGQLDSGCRRRVVNERAAFVNDAGY